MAIGRAIEDGRPLGPVFNSIFTPSVGDFDCILELIPSSLPKTNLQGPTTQDLYSAAKGVEIQWEDKLTPSKDSQVVLSGIPVQLVKSKGAKSLIGELLIGFRPVEILVQELEVKFGHVAWFFVNTERP